MKKIFLLVVGVMLLMVPVMASADTDIVPYAPDSTLNCWDVFGNVGPQTILPDTFGQDPITTPLVGFGELFGAAVTNGTKFNVSGITGFAFRTSADSGNPAEVSAKIFNFPFRETVKNIRVYAKFIAGRFIDSVDVASFKANGSLIGTQNFDVDYDGSGVQKFELQIFPNPDYEILTFKLGGFCDWEVDKLCIATQCVPTATPIPGSLMLLGSGILGIVGIGLRRKSA